MAQPESRATLGGPLTHLLDVEGEEQGQGARLLGGGQEQWGPNDGDKLARLWLNPGGRAGRQGQGRTEQQVLVKHTI